MNERIKALAEQAGMEYNSEHQFDAFNEEKFAELLIQEYEQFLPEICPWSKADQEGPMKGWHVQFVARRHFGLE